MPLEKDAYDELRCYTLAHSDPSFIHQHVVDAFTAQHADEQTKPIALTFALIGLYLHVEKQLSGTQVQRAHMDLARHKRHWPKFPLPESRGSISAADVMATPEGVVRDQAIHAWCASVWQAFRACRRAVAELLIEEGMNDNFVSAPRRSRSLPVR
jgi:hypothetical protein